MEGDRPDPYSPHATLKPSIRLSIVRAHLGFNLPSATRAPAIPITLFVSRKMSKRAYRADRARTRRDTVITPDFLFVTSYHASISL